MGSNFHIPWTTSTLLKASALTPALSDLDKGITYLKNLTVHTDGSITYVPSTGVLTWSSTLRILFNREDGQAIANTVTASSITLADNEFAYLDLSETNNATVSVAKAAVTTGAASNFKAVNRLVIGYRNTASDRLFSRVLPGVLEGAVGPAQLKTRAIVDLADTAVTLTASQMVDSGLFTATPTADRSQQSATAANIIAALPQYQTGTCFDFTIVNTAAFNETLTTNTGVTLVGSMVVNNASATFKCLVTSGSTVSIFRM